MTTPRVLAKLSTNTIGLIPVIVASGQARLMRRRPARSVCAEIRLRRVPVSTGSDHLGGALVSMSSSPRKRELAATRRFFTPALEHSPTEVNTD
jgi:hypothetical protein